jgi:hypothetical protein
MYIGRDMKNILGVPSWKKLVKHCCQWLLSGGNYQILKYAPVKIANI